MSGLCRYMQGAKCAEEHCDFWSEYHNRCITAVKDEKFADVCEKLDSLLMEDPEFIDKLKDATEIAKRMRKIIDK
jgi:hypothetical protein